MIHTEQQIRKIAEKILRDLDVDYHYKDQINIRFNAVKKLLWGGEVSNCWSIAIATPDLQFGAADGAGIRIYIDDETGRIYNYIEGPGRPVPATVKLNEEGKYEFAALEI